MGNIFTLDDGTKSVVQDALDDIITELGKMCKIVYPPRWMSCSNCWETGTIISTPNGPKYIEDIVLGDEICDRFGSIDRVSYKFCNLYQGEMYNISAYGVNADTWVTANHKFPVIRNFQKRYKQLQWFDKNFVLDVDYEEIEAKNIQIGDAVLLPQRVFSTIDLSYIPTEDFGILKVEDDLLEFIGWWLAEGYCSDKHNFRSPCLCLRASREVEIADKMSSVIKKYFGVESKYDFRKDADNLVVYFHSAKFVKWLKQFGCLAENKIIPEYLWRSLSLRQKNIILGSLLQGDGYISNNIETSVFDLCSITSISKKLAFQIWEILHNNELMPSITTAKPRIDKNNVNHARSWSVSWIKNRIQQKSGVRKTSLGYASVVRKIESKIDSKIVYNFEAINHNQYIANNILVNNCIADPIGNKSSNRWKTGGPIPFANGSICPLCSGDGKRAEDTYDTIKLLCNWEPKKFWNPVPSLNLRKGKGILQTKGFISDMPKILKADHLIFQTSMEPYLDNKYKLISEPGDRSNIIQNRYFVCTWEQI